MPYGAYDSPELIQAAEKVLRDGDDPHHFKRAQAIYLPHSFGLTIAQTAKALGVCDLTVARWRNEFLQIFQGQPDRRTGWGGKRHQNLTDEEEKALLESFAKKAQAGGILTIEPIQKAYEQKVGHTVRDSVVYRMLKRHGWRKLAPQRRHPKAKDEVQQEWKKKHCWMPSTTPPSRPPRKAEESD